MANTVIALKKSATPSAAPVDLANGELAINYADGKLFYKHANGTISTITSSVGNSFGTVNANNTLVVSDTPGDVITFEPGTNINIVGDAINDKITISLKNDVIIPSTGTFKVAAVGGDEGGEIKLANAITNSVLSGDVIIDVYQNRLRFYESGGTNRGAFIDLSISGTGVSSNLLAGGTGGTTDTVARDTASAAFDRANSANVLAFNTGIGANAFTSATISGANTAVGTGANAYANLVWSRSNTYADTVGTSANAFMIAVQNGSNTAIGTGANAFASATIAGANTAVGTAANNFTSATIAGANTAVGTGANAFTSATIAGANTAVGTAANNFARATIAGANTAVGAGANAFTSATIAGANTAVGTGANAFTSATIAGANTAVGTGANAFTSATIAGANTAVGSGANAFTSATIAGANTAVGAGANAYANLVWSRSNTRSDAIGVSANAFTSATIEGANTAVGLGANTYANATFVRLTAASQTITGNVNIVGDLTLSGNTFTIDATRLEVDDPLIYLAANNYTSDIVDIGFIGNYVNSTGANVHTGLYREHTDKMYYLFQGYDVEPINNHIGAFSNNMTLAVLNADIRTSNLVLGGANAILTIAGVGTAANNFATATIAGANTAVGVGANAFTSATISGANTAVGAGANSYANLVWSRSNTRSDAIGVSANAFASATIAGANTAVGAGANAFTSATIAGANTAVGAGANTVGVAAFARANNSLLSSSYTASDVLSKLLTVDGAGSGLDADLLDGISSASFLRSDISQQGGKSYVAHDFNSYPNLYDVTFAEPSGSTNLPTGMSSVMSYRFVMGAGDVTNRGFDLVGAAESNGNLFFRERSIGTWNEVWHNNNDGASSGLDADLLDGQHGSFYSTDTKATAAFGQANTALTTGQAAFAKANAALANTSGVSFNGNLNFPTGNVGIGTTSPLLKLDVSGSSTQGIRVISTDTSGSNIAYFTAQHGAGTSLQLRSGAGYTYLLSTSAVPLYMGTNSNIHMTVDPTGNVLIGRTTSTVGQGVILDVAGGINASAIIASTLLAGSASSDIARLRFLEFSNISYIQSGTQVTGSGRPIHFTKFNSVDATMVVDIANGNVGIGTTSPAYKLEVAGSFAAQTKSFVINHPTKPGMMLRHGSLEGPENGVYVRGKLDGKSIIELPDYWWNLVDESTITVNLTPIGRSQDIWVQSTSAYFIHLNQPVDCFFTVFAERKDVDKLVVEY